MAASTTGHPDTVPTSLPRKPSLTLFDLPLEIRRKIYSYSLVDRAESINSLFFVHIAKEKVLPRVFSATNRRLSSEISQYFFDTTVFHVYASPYITPTVGVKDRTTLTNALRKYLDDFAQLPVKRWHVWLLFLWQHYHFILLDAICLLIWQRERTIQQLTIRIPCLCSPGEFGTHSYYNMHTLATWLSDFPPLLDRLNRIRLMGKVTFVPSRQQGFPPCPLRRCKALADHLQYLKTTMEGNTGRAPVGIDVAVTAPPLQDQR